MIVLVACEESQEVTKAFRALGHVAFSCDIEPPSGGRLEWHIQRDVLEILEGGQFKTMDGTYRYVSGWDLMIAHPPCTYLSYVGNRHFSLKMNPPEKVIARMKEQEKAIVFFMRLMDAPIPKVAVENPVGIMGAVYRKPDQIIHPYYFATGPEDTENWQTKRTCLWLRGLNPLEYAPPREKPEPRAYLKTTGKPIYDVEYKHGPKLRSKTFPAVAEAMAEQWGEARHEAGT